MNNLFLWSIHDFNRDIMNNLHLLRVYEFEKKCRLGANSDGGYVIGELSNDYDCYISAGVSDEESFSRDFINKYGMTHHNSFAFDGTIDGYPYNYTDKISFTKKNIGPNETDTTTNLSHLTDVFSNIFLKMDIEGGEYPWIMTLSENQLNKFKQIVIEFHGIARSGWGSSNDDKLKCLEKLSRTHYTIHAHGNNYDRTYNNIPDVIELTFVNKSYFDVTPRLSTSSLPSVLDFPNNLSSPDISLNGYPFKNMASTLTIRPLIRFLKKL